MQYYPWTLAYVRIYTPSRHLVKFTTHSSTIYLTAVATCRDIYILIIVKVLARFPDPVCEGHARDEEKISQVHDSTWAKFPSTAREAARDENPYQDFANFLNHEDQVLSWQA